MTFHTIIAWATQHLVTWPFFFQVCAAVFALNSVWQMGNKSLAGPIWGLVGQSMWFAMIVTNGMWGLLIGNVANTIAHVRNLVKWWREKRA